MICVNGGLSPVNAAGRSDDVIPEPFCVDVGGGGGGGGGLALHMSPGCPSHFILMNCKTFHTLRAQKSF